jgi:DNA-directed RNA polymerase subunit RPC12/RpoP
MEVCLTNRRLFLRQVLAAKGIILFFLLFSVGISGLLYAQQQQKTTKNYQCKKCSTVVKSERMPSALNCLKGGMHQWTDLGEVGADSYQCKKCGLVLKSKRQPSSLNCPSGGMHQWNKLNR